MKLFIRKPTGVRRPKSPPSKTTIFMQRMVIHMKIMDVKVYLEVVALLALIIAMVTGCCKVGKGARVTIDNTKLAIAEVTAPKPYPVIGTALSTDFVKVTYTTDSNFIPISVESTVDTTETTSIETEEMTEPVVLEMNFNADKNIEDDMNVDVTEMSFEPNDYGVYPSVASGYITEEERIFLCNTVGTEYGSDWVSLYDKALVVDTVMTRVEQGCWTNGLESNVYNVLTAPNQYDPSYTDGWMHDNVTESCIDAVEYYFQHKDEFPHYTSFYGDGVENHFYY
jgi:hypothetical protein